MFLCLWVTYRVGEWVTVCLCVIFRVDVFLMMCDLYSRCVSVDV